MHEFRLLVSICTISEMNQASNANLETSDDGDTHKAAKKRLHHIHVHTQYQKQGVGQITPVIYTDGLAKLKMLRLSRRETSILKSKVDEALFLHADTIRGLNYSPSWNEDHEIKKRKLQPLLVLRETNPKPSFQFRITLKASGFFGIDFVSHSQVKQHSEMQQMCANVGYPFEANLIMCTATLCYEL